MMSRERDDSEWKWRWGSIYRQTEIQIGKPEIQIDLVLYNDYMSHNISVQDIKCFLAV